MEWNERLIDALNSLDVEFVWATTWREDAHQVGERMGLTHRGRVLHPLTGVTTFPSLKWKWAAIVDEQTFDPSPFVWIEDEIPEMTAYERGVIDGLGGLLVAPDYNFGVTPQDIERIREYVSQHS